MADPFANLVARSTPDRALAQRLAAAEERLRVMQRAGGWVPAFVYQRAWRTTPFTLDPNLLDPILGPGIHSFSQAVQFDAGRSYGPAMWWPGGEGFLIPWDGLYYFEAAAEWLENGDGGRRDIMWYIGGGVGPSIYTRAAPSVTRLSCAGMYMLRAGAFIGPWFGVEADNPITMPATPQIISGASENFTLPSMSIVYLGRPQ